MTTTVRGKTYLFGNNIDTDQIYPGRYLELTDPTDISSHVMEGADPSFQTRFKRGGILVGGHNFGCGSSREHAAIALQSAGVSLVVAESFARIFFRNCINLGLPLIICPGVTKVVSEGECIMVDIESGRIENLARNSEFSGQPLSGHVMRILKAGGIKPLLKKELGSI